MKKRCKRRVVVPNVLQASIALSSCSVRPLDESERGQFIDPVLGAVEALRVGKLCLEGLRVLIEHAYILFLLIDRISQHGTTDAIAGVLPAHGRAQAIGDAIDGIATRFQRADYAAATAAELSAVRELLHWLDQLAAVVPAGHVMRAMLAAAKVVDDRIHKINKQSKKEAKQ